jgi:hypothetical protein
MDRRKALKIVTLGALAPKLNTWAMADHHGGLPAAWTPADYKLQFFNAAENDLLDQLTEMIIPSDSHSPGAHAAQVSLFADQMVATSDDATRTEWRNGLLLMREEARRSSLADALAKASANESSPTTDLERFFAVLKVMTVNGYYTSEIGIHRDLQYVGNDFLVAFPGCTHPAHQS